MCVWPIHCNNPNVIGVKINPKLWLQCSLLSPSFVCPIRAFHANCQQIGIKHRLVSTKNQSHTKRNQNNKMRNQNNPFRPPPRLAPFKGVQNVTQSNLHSLQNGLLDNQVVQVGGLKYPLPVMYPTLKVMLIYGTAGQF